MPGRPRRRRGVRPAENRAKLGQVTEHSAEVELGDAGVETLEAGCLAQLDATLFYGLRDTLNLLVSLDQAVVGVGFVNAAGIRADEILLEAPEVVLAFYEPQQDGFEARGARVVFFVGVRGRGDYGVNGGGAEKVSSTRRESA